MQSFEAALVELGASKRQELSIAETQCGKCTERSNHIYDYTRDWSIARRPTKYVFLFISHECEWWTALNLILTCTS